MGICGLGTVGNGVFNLFHRNAGRLEEQAGIPIKLVQVGSRSVNPKFRENDFPVTKDLLSLVNNPEIDIILFDTFVYKFF